MESMAAPANDAPSPLLHPHPYSPPPPPPPLPLHHPVQQGQHSYPHLLPSRSPRSPSSTTSPLRLVTALAPPHHLAPHLHGSVHTPASATSLSVPFSPFASTTSTAGGSVGTSPLAYAPSPASVASPMATRNPASVPYNPQQWSRGGGAAVGGQYLPHAQQPVAQTARGYEVTGMEAAMPSPPPPYSPPPTQNISQALGSSPHLSSNSFAQSHPPPPPPPSSTPSSARPLSGFQSRPGSMVVPSSATSITSNHQFPPPPLRNPPLRSASRDKLSSKFSLSSFRNRNNEAGPSHSNMDTLQISTTDAIQRAPVSPGLVAQRATSHYMANAYAEHRYSPDSQSPVRPPASRRAASAGILSNRTETRTPVDESPIGQQGNWSRGMPLPPPPPGPPPSGSRSQSMGPGAETSRHSLHPGPAPPTRRPGQTTLETIPPTPQGWQDEPIAARTRSPAAHGLHIDTSSRPYVPQASSLQNIDVEDVSTSSGPTASTSRSSDTMYRSTPKRDPSARGIRERRSESRAARERTEPNNNPWASELGGASGMPADLDLKSPEGGLSRRGAVTKGTPRSGGGLRSPKSGRLLEEPSSANSTPRVGSYQRIAAVAAPTPPFSPGMDDLNLPLQKAPMPIPSKALPTPPLQQHDRSLTHQSGSTSRPTSQLAHQLMPAEEDTALNTPKVMGTDNFVQSSVERHRRFIEKEMAAETDQDRLEIFADFIVTESRLRRDRYSAAFDAMAGDIVDLTRDLWRSYGNTGRKSATPNAQSARSRRSQGSVAGGSPDTRPSNSGPTTAASPASSMGNFTPHTEPTSPSSASSQKARDTSWANNYHPSLSPIPSMAMSTVPDEEDSRGRSASRWWESDAGSSGVAAGRRLERSKRESKYMSLPKEARENLQWDREDQHTPRGRAGSSSRHTFGPNEYPPEKVGFHEESPHAQPRQSQGYSIKPIPTTRDQHKLDVSRLVTLPPPYPRHHPAVNNSHPDLASIRSNLRNLSSLEEVKETKDKHKTKIDARKEQESKSLAERRAETRYNIQENVQNGVMTFADAAKAEADFETREQVRAQDLVQYIFDTFQAEVANPLHAMFCERITKVSASIEHLKARLSDEAQEPNPNQTQEEGDEKPELLEMLTLLKWLYEAREQLHKEMFELEDERNDLYRDIIILPYVQANNEQKVQEATTFFSRDAQDRRVVSEKEILKRYEELNTVIEQNVTRGVETQLSAFWDIAPGLLAIVQQVPHDLRDFDVLIPPQEFDENPAYHDFPLQYLYSLLAHAGRSAYQFIESQTNLLCLLHEVKEGVMNANSRLLETQRLLEGEDVASVDSEMTAIRADEEQRLTHDLKDKVGLVESQWKEALGEGLEDCKMRVEEFLNEQHGWDDGLRE